MPGTTTDETVTDTIMHLAGKAIGITTIVGIVVAVVV